MCSKRSGPKTNGKATGSEEVTHYTRAPGPRSVPVTTPELWRPSIRRCVLHDRRALLAGLEPLLRSTGCPVPESAEDLRRWHEAAHRKFLEAAEGNRKGELLKRAHYQFSYRIDVAGEEELGMAGLVDELRNVANEVMQFVNSGWPMFCFLNTTDILPRWTVDPSLGDDEFLEVDSVTGEPLSRSGTANRPRRVIGCSLTRGSARRSRTPFVSSAPGLTPSRCCTRSAKPNRRWSRSRVPRPTMAPIG